jgi:hypothetical protein
MLHREALPPGTLELLTTLSANPALASFALAGGYIAGAAFWPPALD